MTLINVRLGFWIPNPGLLECCLAENDTHPTKIRFDNVFGHELEEIEQRRKQAGQSD
ncbi:MAG: hypothetical protein ACKVJU_06250 [Verrucomicrobiales bacterium]